MKMLAAVLSSLAIVGGVTMANGHGKRAESGHIQWCQQNWEKCREYKLEKLAIEEKYIAKQRECLQNAKDYWSNKQCMSSLKVQKKREMYELQRRMMGL